MNVFNINVSEPNLKFPVKEVFNATEYFLSLLLSPSKLSGLTIDISFDSNEAVRCWSGSCIVKSRKNYAIWVRRSLNKHNQLLCLAHELVHVKQFVMKEYCPNTLKVLSPTLKRIKAYAKDEYWDNPAEIEAFGRSEGMVARYYQQGNK